MVNPDERSAITKVLGQVHIADDGTDEDLKAGKEQLKVCNSQQHLCMHAHSILVFMYLSSLVFLSSLPLLLLLSLSLSQSLDMEEDTKSVKRQLLTVCPSLEKMSVLDNLLSIWHGVRVRMFMHYQLAARAYFTFLKLSGDL